MADDVSSIARAFCSSGVLSKLSALQLRLLFAMVAAADPGGEVWAPTAMIIRDATGRRPNGRHYKAIRGMAYVGVIEIVRQGRANGYRLRPRARAEEEEDVPQGAQRDPYIGLVRKARGLSRLREARPPGRQPNIDKVVREAIDQHGVEAVEEVLRVAGYVGLGFDPATWLRNPWRTVGLMRRLYPDAFPTAVELEAEEVAREMMRGLPRRTR